MDLLTPELRAELPALYSQDGNRDPMVYAKFFFPAGAWTWFVTEGQPENGGFLFFGYVIGQEEEWGYFSLSELQGISLHGVTVERDLYFEKAPFKEAIARFRKERGD
ncbi:MAG: DUF2958 domain-containing protein [Pyrinomonadaceae bacterium]